MKTKNIRILLLSICGILIIGFVSLLKYYPREPELFGEGLSVWRAKYKTGSSARRSTAAFVFLKIGDDSDFFRAIELLYDKEASYSVMDAFWNLLENPKWNHHNEEKIGIATQHIRGFLYDEESYLLRSSAIDYIRIVRDRRSIRPLLDILRYDCIYIKRDSAWALKKILDKRDRLYLPMLLEAYELNERIVADEDQSLQKEVRKSILELMVKIENLSAVPKLLEVLKTDADKAAECLSALTKEDFGADATKWLEWWEKNKARILKEEAEKDRQLEQERLKKLQQK